MMARSTKAISEVAAIVVIIVLGVVITISVLLLFPGQVGSTNSTASLNQSSSVGTVSGITTISRSNSGGTPALTNSNLTSLVVSLDDYFGNFSQMTMETRLNENNGTIVSYNVIAPSTPGSSQYFEVNFTLSNPTLPSGYLNSSAVIWFDTRGNPAIVETDSKNYTGVSAQDISANLHSSFSVDAGSNTNLFFKNQTNLGGLLFVTQSNDTFGPAAMTVETYDFFSTLTITPNITLLSALIVLWDRFNNRRELRFTLDILCPKNLGGCIVR